MFRLGVLIHQKLLITSFCNILNGSFAETLDQVELN
jgi:hypothetical protein